MFCLSHRDRVERALDAILLTQHQFAHQLSQLHHTMSALSDQLAVVITNLTSIQTGITSLDAQIQAFQNSPGTLSAADQASLDAIVASSTSLATAANAVVAAPTVPAA